MRFIEMNLPSTTTESRLTALCTSIVLLVAVIVVRAGNGGASLLITKLSKSVIQTNAPVVRQMALSFTPTQCYPVMSSTNLTDWNLLTNVPASEITITLPMDKPAEFFKVGVANQTIKP